MSLSPPAERVGQREVGGFQHWVQVTGLLLGLAVESPLVSTGLVISLLCTNGLRKRSSDHVGPDILMGNPWKIIITTATETSRPATCCWWQAAGPKWCPYFGMVRLYNVTLAWPTSPVPWHSWIHVPRSIRGVPCVYTDSFSLGVLGAQVMSCQFPDSGIVSVS